jgi:hypothetical protein
VSVDPFSGLSFVEGFNRDLNLVMGTSEKLFEAVGTLKTPSQGPEIDRPEAANAKLRFLLLTLLQNTHPRGTSIDEVLADARRVLERGDIVEESSMTPSTLTQTAIREQPQQLIESPSSKEDATLPQPTPRALESVACMTRARPGEINGDGGGLIKVGGDAPSIKTAVLEGNRVVGWYEEHNWGDDLPSEEDLEPTRNFPHYVMLMHSAHNLFGNRNRRTGANTLFQYVTLDSAILRSGRVKTHFDVGRDQKG